MKRFWTTFTEQMPMLMSAACIGVLIVNWQRPTFGYQRWWTEGVDPVVFGLGFVCALLAADTQQLRRQIAELRDQVGAHRQPGDASEGAAATGAKGVT